MGGGEFVCKSRFMDYLQQLKAESCQQQNEQNKKTKLTKTSSTKFHLPKTKKFIQIIKTFTFSTLKTLSKVIEHR